MTNATFSLDTQIFSPSETTCAGTSCVGATEYVEITDWNQCYEEYAGARKKITQLLIDFRELYRLEANWDSYGAKPISHSSIQEAEQAVRYLCRNFNLPVPRAIPVPSGSVQLEWHTKDWSLEIDFDGKGQCSVFVEHYQSNNQAEWEGPCRVALYELIKFFNHLPSPNQ